MLHCIKCITKVDITNTGVRTRFHKLATPIEDKNGNLIDTDEKWLNSRMQQSNWETINQIISLRALPENITTPIRKDNTWEFTFTVENSAAFEIDGNLVGALIMDSDLVPVFATPNSKEQMLHATGDYINIWFEII